MRKVLNKHHFCVMCVGIILWALRFILWPTSRRVQTSGLATTGLLHLAPSTFIPTVELCKNLVTYIEFHKKGSLIFWNSSNWRKQCKFCGLIHIFWTSDYLKQQNGVSTVPMFIVVKDHVTQYNGVAYGCVFNSFWTSMGVRGIRYIIRINANWQ